MTKRSCVGRVGQVVERLRRLDALARSNQVVSTLTHTLPTSTGVSRSPPSSRTYSSAPAGRSARTSRTRPRRAAARRRCCRRRRRRRRWGCPWSATSLAVSVPPSPAERVSRSMPVSDSKERDELLGQRERLVGDEHDGAADLVGLPLPRWCSTGSARWPSRRCRPSCCSRRRRAAGLAVVRAVRARARAVFIMDSLSPVLAGSGSEGLRSHRTLSTLACSPVLWLSYAARWRVARVRR